MTMCPSKQPISQSKPNKLSGGGRQGIQTVDIVKTDAELSFNVNVLWFAIYTLLSISSG